MHTDPAETAGPRRPGYMVRTRPRRPGYIAEPFRLGELDGNVEYRVVVKNFCYMCWLVVVFARAAVAAEATSAVVPLVNAHAHNDYLHERPLLDALDHGFTSVEADIFLMDGKLLVAHEKKTLRPERTLEALYLEPLARRVKENGGRVYRDGPRFVLLIDFKNEPEGTYAELMKVLSRYREMLSKVEDGKVDAGAVTVVLTGGYPKSLRSSGSGLVGIDGVPADAGSELPASQMPMISDKWSNQFTWKGDGEMPASERAKLRSMVEKAHAAGRIVRFWATPEKEAVWRELREVLGWI